MNSAKSGEVIRGGRITAAKISAEHARKHAVEAVREADLSSQPDHANIAAPASVNFMKVPLSCSHSQLLAMARSSRALYSAGVPLS